MAGPPPMPLSHLHNRRAIVSYNACQSVPTPAVEPALVHLPSNASKAAPVEPESRRQRPYLFDALRRASLLTRIVADTLDWDALMHYDFDATLLSLDTVYKSLNHDTETYYLLWVAVHKVLAEESGASLTTGDNVSGCIRYQKTRYLNGLLDAVLEQFLVELGNALLEFVGGTHYTILDPRKYNDDPCVLVAKARSLITRFEKLGRDRRTIVVAIPATEAGIAAAASLQCEDKINVNLTSVSGVIHAAACAQAGATAVTIPVAAIRDWYRDRGSGVTYPEENTGEDSDDAIRDAQTIAAYFRQHGISSTQLLACNIDHVDDACSLAALDALSFDADQARAAEWYDAYPNVQCAIPDSAVRRAASSYFTPPPPLDDDSDGRARASRAQHMLDRMNAEALSAFSAVVYAAIGSDRAAMSLISDIAKREIDWQLALQRPLMYTTTTILRPPAPQSAVTVADKVAQPRDRKRKRKKCRAPEATTLRVPDSETPSTHSTCKRYKLASGAYRSSVSERSATPPPADSKNDEADEDEGGGDSADAPAAGRLWQRLAIGRRDLMFIEEENSSSTATVPVQHACEQVPEFNGCPVGVPVRSRDGAGERRAATGGKTPPPRDSDLGGSSSNPLTRLIEPGHP